MAKYDTIIKGGTIFDGTRGPRYEGDIAIKDGMIAEIGKLNPDDADKVLDAAGLHVAPGFIDLHTHYDAQVNWDPYLTMASWHGVTSVLIGNCGFGFAPCRPEDQDQYMLSMSRVEAIPFDSMKLGMKWNWETFPQWLDTLESLPKGINVMSYMPLSPLMIYVMGYKEAKTRHPTQDELARMCQLMEEALDAGAVGWSAQRLGDGFTSVQRDFDGTPMVTDVMTDEECLAFGEVLRKRGRGFIQLTQAKDDFSADMQFMEQLAEYSGANLLFNAVQVNDRYPHQHRRILKWIDECQSRGIRIWGQAITTPNESRFTWADYNLLDGSEAWRDVTVGSIAERKAAMQKPEYLEALRHDYDHGRTPFVGGHVGTYTLDEVFLPEHKQYEGKTVAELGEMQGRHPIDALVELVCKEDLKTIMFTPPFNIREDLQGDLMSSEYTIPGVSDGGAHTKFITIGRYPTDFLANYTRDLGYISLEEAHYRLSAQPARCAGFDDRGTLEVGMPADIVVYDYENLAITPKDKPVVVNDFPGGEWRYVQYAEGYRWILVNGEVTFKDGECTGALAGQLLRHGSGKGAGQRKAG